MYTSLSTHNLNGFILNLLPLGRRIYYIQKFELFNVYSKFVMFPDAIEILDRKGIQIIKELGHGAFSSIYLVSSTKYDHQLFAMKRTERKPMQESPPQVLPEILPDLDHQINHHDNPSPPMNSKKLANSKEINQTYSHFLNIFSPEDFLDDDLGIIPTANEQFRRPNNGHNFGQIGDQIVHQMNSHGNGQIPIQTSQNDSNDEMNNDVELKALVQLNHPNIIRVYDVINTSEAQYLFLEYCSKGTMKDMCVNGLSKKNFVHYAIPILQALDACHQNSIAHRDIKPENILLDEYERPKLADFGLSSMNNIENQSLAGSLPYMAPELIQNKVYDPIKADIWSLGITFFYMLCGRTPWLVKNTSAIKELIKKGEIYYPDNIDHELRVFLNSILQFSPQMRPSCSEILQNCLFACHVERRAQIRQRGNCSSGKLCSSPLKNSASPSSINPILMRQSTIRQFRKHTRQKSFGALSSNCEAMRIKTVNPNLPNK
ncbi:hypothetical protein TRFO_05537 [Tritrichomonas foetus]|uniref:Protein kinase domain-containing protein n=1 Tax=Tritrichomonas foetus TaxID=1144522 RepID=A0A1J4KA79_9EUKA|nr:hypothetical protein TRFO_05537 [Tritrichomonas foetus]|eukprot:OHT06357.1 hypothetical protein TRFO_05537 [Tritrichomonas foetus]